MRALWNAWMNAEANHDPEAEALALRTLKAATDYLEARQRRLEAEAP